MHLTAQQTAPPVILTHSPRRLPAMEMLAAGILLAAVMAGQIALSRPVTLLSRLFWQDEQFTWFIASDPDLGHSLRALAGGADTNPPALHLITRLWSSLVPGPREVVYRALPLLWLWLGLWALYAVLRRAFAVLPSLAAVLVIWAHPLTIRNAFDVRFYGPLLATGAILCWALGWSGRTWVRAVLVGAIAMLLCTLHYFGVIVLALIVLGEAALSPLPLWQNVKRLVPALAGPIALAACLPMYFGQKAGLTVSTWVPHESIGDYLSSFVPSEALAIVLALWWLVHVLPTGLSVRLFGQGTTKPLALKQPPQNQRLDARLHSQAGLTALLALPAAMIVFSHAVQPAMIPKYGIPTILALAPVVAMLVSRMPRRVAAGAVLAIALLGVVELREHLWKRSEPWQRGALRQIAEARLAVAKGIPVVSMSRSEAYLLHYAAPEISNHVHIVDMRPLLLRENILGEESAAHLLFETEFAEKVGRYYPVPRLISLDGLRAMGRFQLVGWDPWQMLFKRHVRLRNAGAGMYELDDIAGNQSRETP